MASAQKDTGIPRPTELGCQQEALCGMVVAKLTNSSAIFAPIAGFVLCQKLFVQMDISAALCFLGMRVALGLELAPGEECVCVCVCVVCCWTKTFLFRWWRSAPLA